MGVLKKLTSSFLVMTLIMGITAGAMPWEYESYAETDQKVISDEITVEAGQSSDETADESISCNESFNEKATELEATEIIESGSCGRNLTWELDDEGTLTITGSGDMDDFGSPAMGRVAPWGTGVKKLIVGDEVTCIGEYAFFDCTELAEVTLGESIIYLDSYSFQNCISLTSLSLPDSVRSVYTALTGCTGLQSIHIGKGMESVGSSLHKCENLLEIRVSPDNQYLCDIDGVVFSKDKKVLLAYPRGRSGEYEIPEGTVILSDSDRRAGAFLECANLTAVSIPDTVEVIGISTFRGCSGLTEIRLPDSVARIEEFAFGGCTGLTEFVISDSIVSIGKFAFNGCVNLKSIVFPGSLKTIGEAVFRGCTGLEQVTIENGVTDIGDSAFERCKGLRYIEFPESVQAIGQFAFHDCSGIETVVFKGTLNVIGDRAFEECDALRTICFLAGAPNTICPDSFREVTAVAYYNNTDQTWFERSGTDTDPRQNYGGRICWAGWAADPELPERMAGAKRQTTAVAISEALFPDGTENVVIASGDNYPDALAGGPLAYLLDAPILLVCKSQPDEATLSEIERLGAKNAFILGGPGAVGDNVADQLRGKGLAVERIAGSDRFETAVRIAEKMDKLRGGKPSAAFFVYSHNYPDALSISNIAAITGSPILYIEKNGTLKETTKQYLNKCGKVNISVIIGGPALISSNAETVLKPYGEVERLYGANRYETCIIVNLAFRDIVDGDSLCLACGTNYPDALAGSVFAAYCHAPLLLVQGDLLSDLQQQYAYWKAPLNVFAFGGTGVLSENVLSEVKKNLLFTE